MVHSQVSPGIQVTEDHSTAQVPRSWQTMSKLSSSTNSTTGQANKATRMYDRSVAPDPSWCEASHKREKITKRE